MGSDESPVVRAKDIIASHGLIESVAYDTIRKLEAARQVTTYRPSPGQVWVAKADVGKVVAATIETTERRRTRTNVGGGKVPPRTATADAPTASADGIAEAVHELKTAIAGIRDAMGDVRDILDRVGEMHTAQLGAAQVMTNALDANTKATNETADRIAAAAERLARELE